MRHLEQVLLDRFLTTVKAYVDFVLPPTARPRYSVEFSEEFEEGLKFLFTIRFDGFMILDDLQLLTHALEWFCAYDSPRVRLEGYEFRLGDGDDRQAVFFQHGKFCIWLRGWK